MDIRKVKKLIEMLENSNLEEIEIQEGEESVRLVKGSTNAPNTLNTQSINIPQATSPVSTDEESSVENISAETTDGNLSLIHI